MKERTIPVENHKEKRKSIAGISFILSGLLFLFCLLAMLIIWVGIQIPQWAEQEFGKANPSLSDRQRFIYAFQLYWYRSDLVTPLDTTGESRQFTVTLGETIPSIAYRLMEDKVIRNADAFRLYLIYTGLDTSIQAGEFDLSSSMSAIEIARKFQDATPSHVSFGVLAGWRAEEIAALLPTSGLKISKEDFLAAVRDPSLLVGSGEFSAWPTLEGVLYPGVYKLKRDISLSDLILILTMQFETEVTPSMRDGFEAQGLDLYQAVTLASVIQREAVVEEEKPIIASVFLNRLNMGMKLESDPTVQYALGFQEDQNSWWRNPLSSQDLLVNSPYNTYISPGLPPGPICNPDSTSLLAVAFPAQTDYYYFRSACDNSGRHNFAFTYEEHVQNECP